MPDKGLPTRAEIRNAAKVHGYLDESGNYPPHLERRLMNLALELRRKSAAIGEEFGTRHGADLVEQDVHGFTIERIHAVYQDALAAFDDDDRAFALALAIAPALVTRSGLHTESEGTAPDDYATAQGSTEEGLDLASSVGYDEDRDG